MTEPAGGLVLVAEHDPGVAELARRYLARAGYDAEIELDTARAAATAARLRPDAVVLDLSAAGPPGELYRKVRQAAGDAPVVCVVAAGQAAPTGDPGVAVLARPFGPRVLVDAVARALRGRGGDEGHVLRAGTVVLDPQSRTVTAGDRPVALTATEFDLLRFLMGRPGRVFTREQLLEAAWEPGASAGNRTVDVHIAQLRAKLGDASPIRTVRGVGYAVDA
ncbi:MULTISPECIES: response regulator transcription factor [Thermomonospora]|uniref:DNA-binding response OmpR family regulator n=1 Tax=Thermomonospora cellulosilytica TaxID=1411118 RepID=A0A7W3RB75_9ACTN|nr:MULTISPECIES: response regulator transcription factor [Thermomonospora]MBA9006449.1 DNA-binding response OmpR family regulator [Thermomonospora cellulosilytica]